MTRRSQKMSLDAKGVLKAILGFNKDDLQLVAIYSNALLGDAKATYSLQPLVTVDVDKMGPVPDGLAPGRVIAKVETKPRRKPRRKAKAKTKRNRKKDWDAAKVLAGRVGGYGKKGQKPAPAHRGVVAKVMEALQHTSGKIGPPELAEYLGLTNRQVGKALSDTFKLNKEPRLRREATKHLNDDGKEVPMFVYWMEGK